MCTAVSYLSNGLYFGRTRDNDCSYGEEIVITPCRYPLELRSGGAYETTIYASCCSAERGIYYYNSYDNRRIYGVDMNEENLDGKDIMRFPFVTEGGINIQNKREL